LSGYIGFLEITMFETTGSCGSVLICDDDADTREVIAACLTHAGYSVCAVSGYDELRKLLVNLEVEAILLDICMPEYDGFCVADTLRLLGEKAPIIFITAYDTPKRRLSATYISGVAGYLKKPFDPDALLAMVNDAVESRKKSLT
jgi:CheY-like chemotaxis protein